MKINQRSIIEGLKIEREGLLAFGKPLDRKLFRRLGLALIGWLAIGLLALIPFEKILAAVTITEFRVESLGGTIGLQLVWETLNEGEVSGFYVQRASDANPQYFRLPIGAEPRFIYTRGNNEGDFYDLVDENVPSGRTYYYRLEIIYKNQTVGYQGPITYTYGASQPPNPTATFTPEPSPTPSPVPTWTPGPSPTPGPSLTPTLTPTPHPTVSGTPSNPLTATPTFDPNGFPPGGGPRGQATPTPGPRAGSPLPTPDLGPIPTPAEFPTPDLPDFPSPEPELTLFPEEPLGTPTPSMEEEPTAIAAITAETGITPTYVLSPTGTIQFFSPPPPPPSWPWLLLGIGIGGGCTLAILGGWTWWYARRRE